MWSISNGFRFSATAIQKRGVCATDKSNWGNDLEKPDFFVTPEQCDISTFLDVFNGQIEKLTPTPTLARILVNYL